MIWKDLLEAKRIQKHSTSLQEANDIRAVIARDLADANIAELSLDRRFATAYNAALQNATLVLYCAGYRTRGIRHHETTFEALPLVMGKHAADLAAYLDVCRRKRNIIDYDMSSVATETELEELQEHTRNFCKMTEEWIAKNHPEFAAKQK